MATFRKKKIFQIGLLFSCMICPIFTFALGTQQPDLWFESDSLFLEETKYLSTYSLYPFIKGGETEFISTGFAEYPGMNKDLVFPIGTISQKGNSYNAMFLATRDKGSSEIQVRLLYITKDQLLSPVLFMDIFTAALPLLRVSIPHFHVLIEQIEAPDLPKGQTLHRWVFFDPEISKEFHVSLTPDGNGGNYFAIKEPE